MISTATLTDDADRMPYGADEMPPSVEEEYGTDYRCGRAVYYCSRRQVWVDEGCRGCRHCTDPK